VEEQIRNFSTEELRELRSWFAEYDAERWDAQLDADVKAGKLDRRADDGLRDHLAGRSSKL
jgi:hypothetical protein